MAKILPASLAPDALPRIRGVLLTRIARGVIIAQSWPRKRGKITNPNVAFTSAQFSLAAKMAANPEPMSYATAVFLTQGSDWMPRDLLVRAAYGKAYEVTDMNGVVYTQSDHGPPEPAAGLWTPAELGATLLAWYKADTLTGTEGQAKDTWPDSSGNGHNQFKAGSTVNLHLADLNGLNTLAFPGSSPGYYDVPFFYSGKTEAAAFCVMKQFSDPPPSDPSSGWWRFGSAGSSDHFPYIDGNVYDGFGSTARSGFGNPTPSLASWRIVGWHSKFNDRAIFIDGTLFNFTTLNTVGFTSAPTNGAGVSLTNFFRGWQAECFFTDTKLTLDDRQKCEGYLAWKWDLVGNLPSSHPYKTEPPLI